MAALLLTAYLAFLGPLAVYSLVLALINRRSRATMVSGVGDFVGLLLACSGILLVSAPLMIWYSYARDVTHPFGDEPNEVVPMGVIWGRWYLVWIFYYWVLVSGAGLLAWSRRNKTVLYNVDVDRFLDILDHVSITRGLTTQRSGRRTVFSPLEALPAAERTPDTAVASEVSLPASPGPRRPDRFGSVRIEPFHALCNITLHWEAGAREVREEIEDELRRHLADCAALDNPSSIWFTGLCTLLFGLIALVFVFIGLITYLPRR